jgi:hypothetical protein
MKIILAFVLSISLNALANGQSRVTIKFDGDDFEGLENINDDRLKSQKKLRIRLYADAPSAMPEQFGALSAVEELEIICDSITNLAEAIGDLQSLTSLSIEGADLLVGLPETISKLKNLTHLSITTSSSGTGLLTLPESFGGLERLEYLEIYSSRITKLPSSFTELRNITQIFFHEAAFESFPQQLIELKSGVIEIWIDAADLVALPDNLGQLKLKEGTAVSHGRLRLLNCVKIKDLPVGINNSQFSIELFNPTNLQSLAALRALEAPFTLSLFELKSKKQLRVLLKTLGSGEFLELILDARSLKRLPRRLYKLKSLSTLKILLNEEKDIDSILAKLKSKLPITKISVN